MIRPPTKRPCDTLTQAQFSHGLPISGPCSLGAAQAVDGAPLQHGPLRADYHAETEKKWTGGHNVFGRKIKTLKTCTPTLSFFSAKNVSIFDFSRLNFHIITYSFNLLVLLCVPLTFGLFLFQSESCLWEKKVRHLNKVRTVSVSLFNHTSISRLKHVWQSVYQTV